MSFPATVRTFLTALLRPETYLPHRNAYLIFGLMWGAPIPAVTLGLQMSADGLTFGVDGLVLCLSHHPIQWLFLAHPLLFAVVFGAMGTTAQDREHRVATLIDHLENLALTDGLTGLHNHRAFQDRIRREAARAAREDRPVSLALLDLDGFKAHNDRHGHPEGDQVLKEVATRLQRSVRSYDAVCRTGGDEFAVVLPDTDITDACVRAERIREAMNGTGLTISAGVAERREGEPVAAWISRADARLYHAKRSGSNQVCASLNRIA